VGGSEGCRRGGGVVEGARVAAGCRRGGGGRGGAMGLCSGVGGGMAKSKLELASFSQKQEFEADAIGIGIAAHAGYDPYGAARFLTALERNSELKPEQSNAINPAAPDFLSSHPSTPQRVTQAIANARQYKAPASISPAESEQARDGYYGDIDGIVYGGIRAKVLYAAGVSCIRSSALPSPRRRVSRWTTPRRPCSASSAAAARRLRLDVVHGARRSRRSAQYLISGWIENIDPATVEEVTVNGFPGATAVAKGDQWDFRLYAIRFGSDVLPLHLCRQTPHVRHRPLLPRSRQYLPPHEPHRDRAGQATADKGREGGGPTIRWRSWRPGWPLPTARPSVFVCSTGSSRATG